MNLEIIERRKEKRWKVYTIPHVVTQISSTKTIKVFPIVYGYIGNTTGVPPMPIYTALSDISRTPWILEFETLSIKEAKAKVSALSKIVGIENVRLERVVDIATKILPEN